MDLELEFLEFFLGLMESKRVYIVKKERKKKKIREKNRPSQDFH